MPGKIAIIIPAYNAGAGLEKSVRSVLSQTLHDIEVWIVDDGSKDKTSEIADSLKQMDGRVRVIHQENCGCYQARLAALKLIKTPYFGFVDADDLIEPTMYEKMLLSMESNNLDVVQCGYDINGIKQEWRGPSESLNSRCDVLKRYVIPALVEGVLGGTFVWNKLYRNKYDFSTFDPTDKDTTFEDMIYNLQFFLRVERMGFVDETLYHYIINEGSSVKNFSTKTLHDFEECIRIRKAVIPQYGLENARSFEWRWRLTNVRNGVVMAFRSRLSLVERISLVYKAVMLLVK